MIIKGLPVSCSESIGDISNMDIEYYNIKSIAKKYIFKRFSVDIPFDSEYDLTACKAEYIGNSRIDGTPMFDIEADALYPFIFNNKLLKFTYQYEDTVFSIVITDLQYVNSMSCTTVKYVNEKYTRFEV